MGKQTDFKGEIIKLISPLKESDKHDWIKAVAEIKWGDNPQTLDIRKMNPSENIIGAGISLNDEEANTLCNVLLENGFGDAEYIEDAYNKKVNMFKIEETA